MKKIIIACGLLLTVSSVFAQNWSYDKVHSRVGFTINFLGITDVGGSFQTVNASVTAAKADFSDASIQFTSDVKSINTEFDQRDEVLKSADFFDADKYAQITFKSTGVKRIKGNVYSVSGDLTMHGLTKPVDLEMTYNGTTTDPFNKKTVAGFRLTGSIRRSDFNLGAGFPAPTLGDVAHLDANIMLNAN
ncbi:YceI family protein [Mucilaginibacter sp. X4EP1]|uniref:YceI family protein n=1 Tax=Mucilaginibacter sp. X4EP1 TaxID=2723092 RepID=UPI0021697186|nr:YceI family protein [Mucilaginibacter sp. X4EP1]MCS3811998.1 polyisoprenoid-binding protein YceI [Mucilaginibacter sp. X4EP1]